jgi:hypothetical protein
LAQGNCMHKLFHYLLLLAIVFSCVGQPESKRKLGTNLDTASNDDEDDTGTGTGVGTDIGSGNPLGIGSIELTEFVSPQTSRLVSKLSIEKNFGGILYINGANISALSGHLITVRFNFGRNLEPVDVPAVIARSDKVIPRSNALMIAVDFKSRPFASLKLPYDLFDYNNYVNSSNVEANTPVTDPYNENLYCRGLRLNHDTTWIDSNRDGKCASTDEKCLYAYAKILDTGLFTSTGAALYPAFPQLDHAGTGYINDTSASNFSDPTSIQRSKCLPDSNSAGNLVGTGASPGTLGNSYIVGSTSLSYNDQVAHVRVVNNQTLRTDYIYKGPYRPTATSLWEIQGDALFSTTVSLSNPGYGIFRKFLSGTSNATQKIEAGYKSYLFPRAGRMSLRAGVDHFSSSGAFDNARNFNAGLGSNGSTGFMDGCNLRVSSYNYTNDENIASCNVTATIQILARDDKNPQTIVHTGTKLKLQVIRDTLKTTGNVEVLHESRPFCGTSNACSSDECCFNNRCLKSSQIGSCPDFQEIPAFTKESGRCRSDFDCVTFCCMNAGTDSVTGLGTGQCAVKPGDPLSPFCNKPTFGSQKCLTGDQCSVKCQKVRVKILTQSIQDDGKNCKICEIFLTATGLCNSNNLCVDAPDIPDQVPANVVVNPSCNDAKALGDFNDGSNCFTQQTFDGCGLTQDEINAVR